MEPMDLDDDSISGFPPAQSSRRRTLPVSHRPGSQSLPCISPMTSPSRSRLPGAFTQTNILAASSPVSGFSQSAMASPHQRRSHAGLFRGATVDVAGDGSFAVSPTSSSFSRATTPAQGGQDRWRGTRSFDFGDEASCTSMETSDRSDVSEMEIAENSPSPHWDVVRSALGNFSFFTHEQLKEGGTAEQENTQRNTTSETGRKSVSRGASWEPTLSTVQAAGVFQRSRKTKSSPSKPAAKDDSRLSSSKSKTEKTQPSTSVREHGDGSVQPSKSVSVMKRLAARSVVSPPPRSRCGVCGRCVSVLSVLLVVLAVLCTFLQPHIIVNKNFAEMDDELLRNEMASKVFGQHIAMEVVSDRIRSYLAAVRSARDRRQDEPCTVPLLVMSFHGWTGVGKNFVSDIITGLVSASTVTRFLVPHHFPHQHLDEVYRDQVQAWIVSNVTKHSVNFFIFDEMDKATSGVVTGIQNALSKVHATNSYHNPSIVIFLSNSFGGDINQKVFQTMMEGGKRETLTLEDFSPVFGSDRESWYGQLQSAITVSVPFLPLEKKHVVQCIHQDLVTKKLSTHADLVDQVVQELMFTTLPGGLQFSQTGCKRVSDKVNLVAFD